MCEPTGWIVQATAGRDKDELFCVLGRKQDKLLLANGKRRRVGKPKEKNPGHVLLLEQEFDHPAIRKLRQAQPVTDRELRRALAAFKGR